MTQLTIGVGSENPVKRHAVEKACHELGLDASIESVSVESGVPKQPMGVTETRTGALERAAKVHDKVEVSLSVGIEGGIGPLSDDGLTFLLMWVAVDDGDDVTTVLGPAMPLPTAITTAVSAGTELGDVLRDRFGKRADSLGAAGILTDGHVDRERALRWTTSTAISRHRRDTETE